MVLVTITAAGCTTSIGKVNARAENYYGNEITVAGRVGDILLRTDTGRAEVFHLVSDDGERIIVVVPGGIRSKVGDGARIRGELVAQHTYEGRTYYDVVVAQRVRDRSRWREFPFIF